MRLKALPVSLLVGDRRYLSGSVATTACRLPHRPAVAGELGEDAPGDRGVSVPGGPPVGQPASRADPSHAEGEEGTPAVPDGIRAVAPLRVLRAWLGRDGDLELARRAYRRRSAMERCVGWLQVVPAGRDALQQAGRQLYGLRAAGAHPAVPQASRFVRQNVVEGRHDDRHGWPCSNSTPPGAEIAAC